MRSLCLLLAAFAVTLCLEQPLHGPTHEADVVRFSNELYSQLGTKSPEVIAKKHRAAYAALNTDGNLGVALTALYELRALDLQFSLARVEAMQMVLALLEQN
jgi:hypothetical protein